MLRLFVSIVLLLTPLAAQNPRPAEDSKAWINKGVQAFRSARYAEAVEAFQNAINLDPASVSAHLYLGTAYMQQWIPGAPSPENDQLPQKAESEFQTVLQLKPDDLTALASLASLAYNQAAPLSGAQKMRKLDQAKSWFQRVIGVNPQNKEAYYTLGVIGWTEFYPQLMAARSQAGMRPETPGPLANPSARQDLKLRYSAIIEDAIANLTKALELDPEYDDAMAYMNLLIRERGDLRDTAEEYKADVATADQWIQKALDAKRTKAALAGGASGVTPPPPPPPPATGAFANGPERIRVGGAVQAVNLIRKVAPIYPPLAKQARIQGVVRFTVIIGKDGTVTNMQLVSGHPMLVPAAQEAVSQWVYRPTLLNGQPVEVITTIDVNFTLLQ